jgi:hypothetical protein
VQSAIAHLQKLGESGTVDLPADGRYSLANDVLAVGLRLDLGVCDVVSGDLFPAAGGHREYVGSFRSEPGKTLDVGSNPIGIVAEDLVGNRTRGQLRGTAGRVTARSVDR